MVRKLTYIALGLIFALFAYFQLNDPDGLKWVFYYLIICSLCLATVFSRNRMLYLWIMLLATLLWMSTLLPSAISWIRDGMPSIADSMQASSPYIELVREFFGLTISLLVIISMLVIQKKRKKV